MRHYLGRAFATLASTILRVRIYDPQCAANSSSDARTLSLPPSRPLSSPDWHLIVELLGPTPDRSTRQSRPFLRTGFVEEPLTSWRDRSGYRVRPVSMAIAARDLILIA
jgi:hypothetical protein